ncbi:unnamed protein product, partial [Staurois parvus]
MSAPHILGALLLLLTISVTNCNKVNRCVASRAKTCTECIRVNKECSYCTDENFQSVRCDLQSNLIQYGCSRAGIVYMESEVRTLMKEQINTGLVRTQVYPQRMSMRLRAGEEHSFEYRVFEPMDTPVDLYIL